LEAYWQGTLSQQELIATGKALLAEKLSLLPALLEALMTFTLQTTRRGLDEVADP